MKVIDRYIIREFLKIFSLALIALICVSVVVDLFERVDDIVKFKPPLQVTVTYFLAKIPSILFITTPISILLSTLLTLGTLSRNSEIISMFASGISAYRISIPLLILGFIVSVLLFIFNETIIPWANQQAEASKLIMKGKQPPSLIPKSGVWFRNRAENRIYNIKFLLPAQRELQGLTIYMLDDNFNIKERIDVRTARYTNGEWILYNGYRRIFNGEVIGGSLLPEFGKQGKKFSIQPTFEDFQRIRKDPEDMTYQELQKYIIELQSSGYDASRYKVDLHGKIAFPFVSMVMVIIGFPFALKSPRSGTSVSIGLSIFIGFSYWTLLNLGLSLGHAQLLPPFLSAWVSHILFASAGSYMILSVQT